MDQEKLLKVCQRERVIEALSEEVICYAALKYKLV